MGGGLRAGERQIKVDNCMYVSSQHVGYVGTNCPSLINLDLTSNKLSGSLPPLHGAGDLHIVQLSNNSMVGPIPNNFGEGKLITTINLAYNKLTGTLPTSLALGLQYLAFLSLRNNAFTVSQRNEKSTNRQVSELWRWFTWFTCFNKTPQCMST